MKEIKNKIAIQGISPKNNVFVAPLAGITDKVFRSILHEMGVGFCYTEMVSAKALIYQNKKTHEIMNIKGEESYCGIQLFGPDPLEMAEAAKMAEAAGAPLIDINMGCPVPKVVSNGEGSALLLDNERALNIAEIMVKAVKVPVTAKLRKGFHGENGGILLAKSLEDVGIAAVTIHGRDRVEYYSGKADRSAIKTVKENGKIPVLGNGDIFSPEDAVSMLEETDCDGVMLARGVLGNPWLVQRTVALLKNEALPPIPTSEQRVDMAIYHLEECCKYYGEWMGIRSMRKFLNWYLKGFHGAAKTRAKINQQTNRGDIIVLLKNIAKENENVFISDHSVLPEI